jgi:hypothetical protein
MKEPFFRTHYQDKICMFVVSYGRSPAMPKLYAVADVCRKLGWSPSDNRLYQRVHGSICVGHAGQVARVGRSFALTAANVRRLVAYLQERWKADVAPATPTVSRAAQSQAAGVVFFGPDGEEVDGGQAPEAAAQS